MRPLVAAWLRELGLGARLAAAGGRSTWTRTTMTAAGVGLGVALLLLAASAPHALDARDARAAARDDAQVSDAPRAAGPRTLLIADSSTDVRGREVRGRLVRAEGRAPVVPPGLRGLPGPGQVVVSPALRDLLGSADGALVRDRLPGRVVGTIGDAGLTGPGELAYYAGATGRPSPAAATDAPAGARGATELRLGGPDVRRIDAFGSPSGGGGLSPILAFLVVVALVVLLVPVGVFVAAAVRFGGERRDRRLAALSLVGADRRMVRRVAAGEALLGALLGLVAGGVLFLAGRVLVSRLRVDELTVFATDLRPAPGLALLVVLAVPVLSVVVTQLALSRVAVEPLGVVRHATRRRRRVLWRLAVPVLGALLLVPLLGTSPESGEEIDPVLTSAGVALLLVGVTAVLPWLVEVVVARLRGDGVPWTLAVRRLQADAGASARVVSGIAVAVAGSIALVTLFTAVQERATVATGADVARFQAQVQAPAGPGAPSASALAAALRAPGILEAQVVEKTYLAGPDDRSTVATVGTCAVLRRLAVLPSCTDGDAFVARGGPGIVAPRPGSTWRDGDARWRVPAAARSVAPRSGAVDGGPQEGVLLTPRAADRRALPGLTPSASVRLAAGDDALERLRTAAAGLSPLTRVVQLQGTREDEQFTTVRRGILVGAVAVLALIGASMLVSALEQLHERRRLLASLVAVGTPPRVLRRSILLQTAVPVALGLAVAVVVGVGLGALLLRVVGEPVRVVVGPSLLIVGVGAAVVPLVTALSAPALGRVLRPEGLRTE